MKIKPIIFQLFFMLILLGCASRKTNQTKSFGGTWKSPKEYLEIHNTHTFLDTIPPNNNACFNNNNTSETFNTIPIFSNNKKEILIENIQTKIQHKNATQTKVKTEPLSIWSLIMAALAIASLALPGILVLSYFLFSLASFILAIISISKNQYGLFRGYKLANAMISISFVMIILGLLAVFNPVLVLSIGAIALLLIIMLAYAPWGSRKK